VQLQGFNVTGCGGSVFAVHAPDGGRPVVLSDMTLQRNEGARGGGVAVTQGAVVLRRCAMAGNSAREEGGAVHAAGSAVWLHDCRLEGNNAPSGGAVAAQSSRLLISGSVLEGNAAISAGGAVLVRGAPAGAPPGCWGAAPLAAHVAASNISANEAANGGGVALSAAAMSAQRLDMWSNAAGNQGGAVAASEGSRLDVVGAVLDSNRARNGGGVHLSDGGRLLVEAAQLHNNTASAAGGVVYVNGTGSAVTFKGSAFDYNWAKLLGGVATVKDGNRVAISGCNFTRNEAEMAAGVLYGRYINVTVEASRFALNWAGQDGGALYCAGFCDWQVGARLGRLRRGVGETARVSGVPGLFVWCLVWTPTWQLAAARVFACTACRLEPLQPCAPPKATPNPSPSSTPQTPRSRPRRSSTTPAPRTVARCSAGTCRPTCRPRRLRSTPPTRSAARSRWPTAPSASTAPSSSATRPPAATRRGARCTASRASGPSRGPTSSRTWPTGAAASTW
jgi:hypothetical protein